MEMIAGAGGSRAGSVEAFMDIGDFWATGASFRADIREFKNAYMGAVKAAKQADARARAGGRICTRRRWKACRILADFERAPSNKFVIVNYREACSRDLGVSLRRAGAYLDFGANFSDGEVFDEIPFSLYAELASRAGALRSAGLLDAEKARLVGMARSGLLPRRDEYRLSLRA